MKLAAAACQNLAAFGFLLGNCNAIGKALAILAGIEDLPECRDPRRSLDGRSRGELSRENLLRAGHYFEMAGERAKADYWFGKTKASFAKSPL